MFISKVVRKIVLWLYCGAFDRYSSRLYPQISVRKHYLFLPWGARWRGEEEEERRECVVATLTSCSVWLRTGPARQKIPKYFYSDTSVTCGGSGSWTLFIVRHFHGINIGFINILNVTTCLMIRKSYTTWNKRDDSSQASLLRLNICLHLCK